MKLKIKAILALCSLFACHNAIAFESIRVDQMAKSRVIVTAQKTRGCAISALDFECWGKQPWEVNEISGPITPKPKLVNPSMFASNGKDLHCALDEGKVKCWGNLNTNHFQNGDVRFMTIITGAPKDPFYLAVGYGVICTIDESRIGCSDYDGIDLVKTRQNPSFKEAPELLEYGVDQRSRFHLKHPTSMCIGVNHRCVIDGGQVACWGDRYGSADSRGTQEQWEAMFKPPPMTNVTQVACGLNYSCAVHDGGKVDCWGMEEFYVPRGKEARWELTPVGRTTPPRNLAGVTQISLSEWHGCSVGNQGARCWGFNPHGETNVPDDLVEPSQVSVADGISCAAHQGGAKCWGDNQYGQREAPPKFENYIYAMGIQKLEYNLDSIADSLVRFKGDILVKTAEAVVKYPVSEAIDEDLKKRNERARYFAFMRLENLIKHSDSQVMNEYLPTYKKLQKEASDALHIHSESDYPISDAIEDLSLVMIETAVSNTREFYFSRDEQIKYEAFLAEIGFIKTNASKGEIASKLVKAIDTHADAVNILIQQSSSKAVGLFINDVRKALAAKLLN